MKIVEAYVIAPDRPFRLRPSIILQLHDAALNGLSAYAGNWRPGPLEISKSKHKPPDRILVPEFVEDMCDYVNDHWESTAVHLAAYLMWRLNWIHPFDDGNGRTSRIVSYIVMCIRLGTKLPGTPSIPEQISKDRRPYFAAIEAADAACLEGRLDVSEMEKLLTGMLATQLLSVVRDAGGTIAGALLQKLQ